MSKDIRLLVGILIIAFIVLVALIIVFIILNIKKKNKEETIANSSTNNNSNSLSGNKQSIFNFMEFDTIEDNMIIQNDGSRFLMVVDCQGINYDLMSGVEKTSVEEGFVQFLNTLRHPVQIYIQTRTINLESSIQTYKDRVKTIEANYNKMKLQYEQMKSLGNYTEGQLNKAHFELTKQRNLYEYGKDVIYNTEKMSLNKNVLNKKYYIVVPYYASELESNNLDKEETKNLAFSEVYTRAQSIVRALSVCGVRGKILNSNELIDLLYMAYNRDEAEVFGLDKAIRAGYDDVYSTAPDVLNKKMKELDKYIEEKAIQLAKEKFEEVKTEKQKAIEEKEESLESLIDQMAKIILKENERYIGKDMVKETIEKIDSKKKTTVKGGKESNGSKEKKTRTRKTTKSDN